MFGMISAKYYFLCLLNCLITIDEQTTIYLFLRASFLHLNQLIVLTTSNDF